MYILTIVVPQCLYGKCITNYSCQSNTIIDLTGNFCITWHFLLLCRDIRNTGYGFCCTGFLCSDWAGVGITGGAAGGVLTIYLTWFELQGLYKRIIKILLYGSYSMPLSGR